MNFPPPFRSLHSSLFIAFHYLLSPFIAAPSHCPPTLCSPPFCPRLAPFCPPLAPFCPRLAPFCPRLAPVLSSPLPALSPCPRIPLLHTCFPPASSPHLFHTSVFHAPLSALLCFASLCFTPSIVLHRFALLSPIVYPLRFIYSHCFAPVFLLPGNLRKPVPDMYPQYRVSSIGGTYHPDTAKGNVFLIFQRNFAKSP